MNIGARIVAVYAMGIVLFYAFSGADLFDVQWRMPVAVGLASILLGCMQAFWMVQQKRILNR